MMEGWIESHAEHREWELYPPDGREETQEDFLEDVISVLLSMRKKENKTSKKEEKRIETCGASEWMIL